MRGTHGRAGRGIGGKVRTGNAAPHLPAGTGNAAPHLPARTGDAAPLLSAETGNAAPLPPAAAGPPSVCGEGGGRSRCAPYFRKKIPAFVDRAGCLCYNEAENSPMRSVFGERMPTDLVRAARFAAVGGIVCISLRLRRRGVCRGEASPPPTITSFCMENIPLPRII